MIGAGPKIRLHQVVILGVATNVGLGRTRRATREVADGRCEHRLYLPVQPGRTVRIGARAAWLPLHDVSRTDSCVITWLVAAQTLPGVGERGGDLLDGVEVGVAEDKTLLFSSSITRAVRSAAVHSAGVPGYRHMRQVDVLPARASPHNLLGRTSEVATSGTPSMVSPEGFSTTGRICLADADGLLTDTGGDAFELVPCGLPGCAADSGVVVDDAEPGSAGFPVPARGAKPVVGMRTRTLRRPAVR